MGSVCMNQVLKRKVFHRGTVKQWKFISRLTEMTEDEEKALLLLHDHKDDQYIQDELGINRKTFDLIMESMCSKVFFGLTMCVNYARDNMILD